MRVRATILILVGLWGAVLSLRAQSVLVSDELNLKNDYTYELIGVPGDYVLLFRDRAFTYEVSAFDQQMRLRWERELDFEKRKIDLVGSAYQDSFFNIFYSYRDRDQRTLRVNRYDANAFLKDTVTITVDDQLASGAKWRYARSEAQNKVILFGPSRKKEVRFMCFDVHGLTTDWDITVPFADTLSGKDFKQLIVSDAGQMYLILEDYSGGLVEANYRQEIWTFAPGKETLERLELELEDWVAQDTRFACDNVNDRLNGVSLVGEKETGRSKGILLLAAGDHGLEDRQVDLFDEELLRELYGQEGKVPRGIADFEIRDLVLREDGGVVVLLEMIKEYTRKPAYPYSNIRNDNPVNFRRWVDFYHEDLLVMSYGPGGAREWSAILRKRQYSQDDDGVFSSYYLFRTPSFLHLVYNDEIRNENTVSEYVVNGDGEFVRNSLLSTASQRLKLRFRDAIQTGPNSFVVPSERANRLMLVKFIY